MMKQCHRNLDALLKELTVLKHFANNIWPSRELNLTLYVWDAALLFALRSRRILGCPPPVVLPIHRGITRQRRTLTAGTRRDMDNASRRSCLLRLCLHNVDPLMQQNCNLAFERSGVILVGSSSGHCWGNEGIAQDPEETSHYYAHGHASRNCMRPAQQSLINDEGVLHVLYLLVIIVLSCAFCSTVGRCACIYSTLA